MDVKNEQFFLFKRFENNVGFYLLSAFLNEYIGKFLRNILA